MAKRFTDTDKFIDPWYRRLSTPNKLLWDWLLCYCDHAGFISLDLEFAEMVLGEKYQDDVIEKHFSERVLRLAPSKYFIPKFIKFQYGKLNKESRVHRSVFVKLEEHGINPDTLDVNLTHIQRVFVNTNRLKDKDIDQDKDKDKAKDKDKESVIFTPDHVIDLWNAELGISNGRVSSLGSNKHLRNCLESIKYLPDEKSWVNLFTKVKSSPFLMGENDRGWFVPLTWLVDYDNTLRIISDEFDSEKWKKNLFASMKSGESA